MQILDLDLDFFLDDIAYDRNDRGKRLNRRDYRPWDEEEVRHFLEKKCLLSTVRRRKGKVFKHHDEAFWTLRELVDERYFRSPFDIVHVDAHADLGMGFDNSPGYIMTDLLHKTLGERAYPDRKMVKPGNWLLFAVACRWLRQITYVLHPVLGDLDISWVLFKDFSYEAGSLQLKRCSPNQYDRILFSSGQDKPQVEVEPEVPLDAIPIGDFQADRPFSFVFLSWSPGYTPSTSDFLIPIIKEYIDEI